MTQLNTCPHLQMKVESLCCTPAVARSFNCLVAFQVNMFTNQGTVIHFNNPKVQASLAANTFTITGHAETKQLTEMLPSILNQLGADSLTSLRRLAEALPKQGVFSSPNRSDCTSYRQCVTFLCFFNFMQVAA